MTEREHNQRRTDPKCSWDFICLMCRELAALIGVLSVVAAVSFAAGFYWKRSEVQQTAQLTECQQQFGENSAERSGKCATKRGWIIK